jgi:transcriptional regulator with XRE-family HTH domain
MKEVKNMAIGNRLYNLRKEKNISQEELANALDVSRQTISKWETGESTPDFNKICPLCEYFGITSDELLSGKQNIIEAKKEDKKAKFARNLAIAVGLYIFSLVAIILCAALFDQPIIGVSVFFTIIAVATGLIIYSSIVYGKSEKEKVKESKEPKNVVLKGITEIISIAGVIAYLLISFLTGAWHITWIIFIAIGLVNAIVKLIFGLKDDTKEEVKGEEDNE